MSPPPFPATPPPKRILVVDDEDCVRAMLERVLTGEGYLVQKIGDGEGALGLVAEGRIDLVLLDLGLPPTNGWDILTRMRTQEPRLPIVIITARFGESATALLVGADALLEKPLDYPTLLRTISGILAEAPGTRRARA